MVPVLSKELEYDLIRKWQDHKDKKLICEVLI